MAHAAGTGSFVVYVAFPLWFFLFKKKKEEKDEPKENVPVANGESKE